MNEENARLINLWKNRHIDSKRKELEEVCKKRVMMPKHTKFKMPDGREKRALKELGCSAETSWNTAGDKLKISYFRVIEWDNGRLQVKTGYYFFDGRLEKPFYNGGQTSLCEWVESFKRLYKGIEGFI